ncbi:MAG TPA: carbohydrate-binding family 9-like protein [Thermoanaerobaculia bacterium]|nr:carbohydrate-binding family 9-like protein [Thermoanaerobaculia bacterium]
MPVAVLAVPRAEFSIEDPWAIPSACAPVALQLAVDGGAPRLETSVAAYYDDDILTIVFRTDDDEEVVATYLGHDEPLWQEDVVEVFLAPAGLTPYFEIEVNPLGTTFDARIDSPDGARATMTTDLSWTCTDLFAALRREGRTWHIVIRLPFASLGVPPRSGDEWRANLFRIDRSTRHGDEFSAWQPSLKTPPDFHVAAAFGVFRFT